MMAIIDDDDYDVVILEMSFLKELLHYYFIVLIRLYIHI